MLFSSSAGGGLIAFSGLRIAMDSCIVAGGGLISINRFYLEVGNGMLDVWLRLLLQGTAIGMGVGPIP